MTEQELRENFIKKLTKLLYDLDINIYIQGTNKIFATFGLANEDIEHIADRLIAAGIGDVKETKFESDHYWRMWQGALVELERAERRAKVAERALQIADELGELCGRKEDYVQQAEKELAEEKKE